MSDDDAYRRHPPACLLLNESCSHATLVVLVVKEVMESDTQVAALGSLIANAEIDEQPRVYVSQYHAISVVVGHFNFLKIDEVSSLLAIEGKMEVDSPPISMTRMNQAEEKTKIRPKIGNGFADVAGMSEIKSLMQKKIINILKNPEKAKRFKIQIPNGYSL